MTGNAFDPLPLPSSVPVPMCFYGDPYKVAKSDEEDTYRQRYWMCFNFAFEPILRQRRINKMVEDKEMMEKRRREEAAEKEHKEEEKRRRVAAYREEREKKLEGAHRAKTTMEENLDALRKRK
ncbi:rRNA-processing protein CGR1-like [Miscanthus floridulus]|uniref:rRNA-processing protein CGR1-like n=1 Tax=Miscanthus floridulus TaxID=154761 RepID=UPI00345A78B3